MCTPQARGRPSHGLGIGQYDERCAAMKKITAKDIRDLETASWSVNKHGHVVIHTNSWSRVTCPFCGRSGRASRIKHCIALHLEEGREATK